MDPDQELPSRPTVPPAGSFDEPPRLPKQIGQYSVEGILGRGGMGIVYRGLDKRLDRPVAIKGLADLFANDSGGLKRFQREARLLASLNHPNIATVYELEDESGRSFLIMELVEGETLSARLARGPMDIGEALRVSERVAAALGAAHEREVVHRDLKPGNVMVGAQGIVKVLDFGLAKRVPGAGATETGDGTSLGTISTAVMGTPGYMSPEQILGGPVDQRTDVFAFGCLLYESLTAQRTFPGATVTDRLVAGLQRDPNWGALPAGTPRAVRSLLKRCLEKDAERRCRMAEARDTLERAIQRLAMHLPTALAERAGQEAPRHNLPSEVTSFVGRETVIDECLELLETGRLVTLTGVGGAGKTRLAIRIAAESLAAMPDGVWFVDLTPITDPARVASTVAEAIEAREEAGAPPLETLIAALRERRALVVLDNCENLIEACQELVVALLTRTIVRVLATSREPLRVPGERAYSVPPLSAPSREGSPSAEEVARYEAVELFVERASRADPAFRLDARTAPPIAEICRRLDGLPLAIELAAARARVLSAQEIAAKLEERFRLLTGATKEVSARHQRLWDVIAWSYEHLGPEEQRLLWTLSVFSGGATLQGALAVHSPGSDEFAVLELLTQLVEKSLVTVEHGAVGTSRYRVLETVRQFARMRLAQEGEERDYRDRHLDFFLSMAEEAGSKLATAEEAAWIPRLAAEHENLLDAMAWCGRNDDYAVRALRLAGQLWRFWLVRGELRLSRRMLGVALALRWPQEAEQLRGNALRLAGNTELYLGAYDAARSLFDEALAIFRRTGDKLMLAAVLTGRGIVAASQEDIAGARASWEEGLALFREVGNKRGISLSLGNLGELLRGAGDLAGARALTEEAIPLMRESGDMEALVLHNANLTTILLGLNCQDEARARLEEALRMTRDLGIKRTGVDALESAGRLAVDRGEPALAARWFAAALAHREAIGAAALEGATKEVQAILGQIRDSLGDASYEASRREGTALSYESAVEEALAWVEKVA